MSATADSDMSIREWLERRAGGRVKLPASLVDQLEDHLLNVSNISEVQQILDLGDGGICLVYESLFDTEAGESPDKLHTALLAKWSSSVSPSADTSPRKTSVEMSGKDAGVGAGHTRTTTMKEDLARLGFTSGAQQTAFDVSLNNGTVHEEAEVAGEEWGKDPVTTEAGVARRKAKTGDSLPELLSSNNGHGVVDLLNGLVREYTVRGRQAEANVITKTLTALLEIFGTDMKAVVEYLKAYRRKYRGRGLPYELDVALVIKGMKSTDTSSLREDVGAYKKTMDLLSKKVDGLTSRLDQLASKVSTLERRGANTPGQGGGPPSTYKCPKCGITGDHWASKCPLKKEKPEVIEVEE